MRITSPLQQRVFDFVKGYLAANREAPTIMEIGNHLHIGVATVHLLLTNLERDGLIKRTRRWRSIEIVNHPINAS